MIFYVSKLSKKVYGCPADGGFGMGLDRITMLLLGISTLKETMFLFRGPNRLTP